MKNRINAKKSKGQQQTVLVVVSVVATSGKNLNETDCAAIEVLQSSGFVALKSVAKKISARAPGGDTMFLIDYDANAASNQKPFKLVYVRDGSAKEIESGRTIYIQQVPGPSGTFEVLVRGDCKLTEWDFTCAPADKKTIEEYVQIVRTKGILPQNGYLPNLSSRRPLDGTLEADHPSADAYEADSQKLELPPRLGLSKHWCWYFVLL